MNEPSIDDITRAQTTVCECLGIGGARSESLRNMVSLRLKKTTWVGKYENDVRFCIDNMLDELAPQWREESTK